MGTTRLDHESGARPWRRALTVALTALALGALPGSAHAAPCPAFDSPIYVIGGSASKNMLAKYGQALTKATTGKVVLVYKKVSACDAIYNVLNQTKITSTVSFWDGDGKETTCDLAAPVTADLANMANSSVLCKDAPSPLPATIGDYEGSVNTVNFIASAKSSQNVISAEAAYLALGFGPAGQSHVWINDASIAVRTAASAVQQLAALAIGLLPEQFTHGTQGKDQDEVISVVQKAVDYEASLGIVSGESVEGHPEVKTLAYQHRGQHRGYLPDSSSSAKDKKNVRDGRYFIWTPQHFFARLGADGTPETAGARLFVGFYTGAAPIPGLNLLEAEIKAGTVPRCAMNVWRDGDLGKIRAFKPTHACGCYFDSLTGGTSCKACETSATCSGATPVCSAGYCEAQ